MKTRKRYKNQEKWGKGSVGRLHRTISSASLMSLIGYFDKSYTRSRIDKYVFIVKVIEIMNSESFPLEYLRGSVKKINI